MSNIVRVGMADLNVCKAPDILITVGLGSCIGLTLYDPIMKIGGMVHYMLPDSRIVANNTNIAKFADTGIPEEMLRRFNIRLVAEDTGLNFGRTVELHTDTGDFYIKAVKKPVKII